MGTFDGIESVDPKVVADANAALARQVLSAIEFKVEERVVQYVGYRDVLVISVGGEIVKEVVIKQRDLS